MNTYDQLNYYTMNPSGSLGSSSNWSAAKTQQTIGVFGQAISAYYSAQLQKAQYGIASEQNRFNFLSGQLNYKSNLLQMKQQLTTQQFQLKAASFGLQIQAVQFRMEALASKYQAGLSDLNARQAEREAQGALMMGNRESGRMALIRGMERETTKANQGARGVVLGEGSAGEIVASQELMKEADALTIRVNSVNAANAKRTESVNYENQADIARLSAESSELSAFASDQNSITPSLLSDIAGQSAAQRGQQAAGINTSGVPSFITATPDINPTTEALGSLFSNGTRVAASWYT